MKLSTSKPIVKNQNGGFYINGQSFSEKDWYRIVAIYDSTLKNEGKCSIRQLAKLSNVSNFSAAKAIKFYKQGRIEFKKQGNPLVGLGSRSGLNFNHHRYIYTLYLKNPARQIEDYVDKFFDEFSILLSPSFISKWFQKAGPYKGTFRGTSLFPEAKATPRVLALLNEYLAFIVEVADQRRLVFADEKPMKAKDLFGKVRRDPLTGITPHHSNDAANRKVRYNIFAAVTTKPWAPRSVNSLVMEERGDAFLFREFVMHLIEEGTLEEGDIFVVDNCSIHFKGENRDLEVELWNQFQILMLLLPPYHPELNPTEFIFAYLVMEMRIKNTRKNVQNEEEFIEMMELTLDELQYETVWAQFEHCGYLKNLVE